MQYLELIRGNQSFSLKGLQHTGWKHHSVGLATPQSRNDFRVILKEKFTRSEEFVRVESGLSDFAQNSKPTRNGIRQSGRDRFVFQIGNVAQVFTLF